MFRSVQDEVAFDAWRIYGDDEHHFIPPEVVNGIVIVLVTEFVKGTGAFKYLGKTTRDKLDALVLCFRERRDLKSIATDPYLQLTALPELDNAAKRSNEADTGAGQERLVEALRHLGLPEKLARKRAASIAKRIAAHRNTSRGG